MTWIPKRAPLCVGVNGVTISAESYTTAANEPTLVGVRLVTTFMIDPRKLGDVLVTAFEGGSNYWIGRIARVGDAPSGARLEKDEWFMSGRDFDITEEDADKDGVGGSTKQNPLRLGLEGLAIGVLRAAHHKGVSIDTFLKNHDADDADLAVQFALFGEIIYG